MFYEKNQAHLLVQIAEIICRLDATFEKLEITDGRLRRLFEQEKAIHEIRRLLRNVNKGDRLEERYELLNEMEIEKDIEKERKALAEISEHFDRLEAAVCISDDAATRVKEYFEQRKALHEVRRVLHYIGKYDKYNKKELEAM